MLPLLNYRTGEEFADALGEKISDYKVGLDNPIPLVRQSPIYQIKLFCPGIIRIPPIAVSSTPSSEGWAAEERKLPIETGSVLLSSGDRGKVEVTSEWYGLEESGVVLLENRYRAEERSNRVKTGDFNYEIITLKPGGKIHQVVHGTYDEPSVVESLHSVTRLLHELFALYEVAEVDEAWKKRSLTIRKLRRLSAIIGDPNRLFFEPADQFYRELRLIRDTMRGF